MCTDRATGWVRGMLLLALAATITVGLGGCSIDKVSIERTASVAPAVTTGTSAFSGAAFRWTDVAKSVPLSEALEKVGAPVSLPHPDAVGSITKIALDETAASPEGVPGLLVLFSSGVQLFIAHRVHDMTFLGAGAAPFTDGRATALELRDVDGTPTLVGEAGTQVSSHGKNSVLAKVMWNAGGLGYTLVAPVEDQSTQRLMGIMRMMRPAR